MRINYHVCANSLSLQLEDGEADLQKGKIAHLNAAWHYWAINENCCSVLIRDVRSRGWGYYSFQRLEGNSFSCSSCSHRRERGEGRGEGRRAVPEGSRSQQRSLCTRAASKQASKHKTVTRPLEVRIQFVYILIHLSPKK